MELELIRTYYPGGTNGMIYINKKLQCFSIELPWLDNKPRVSCIPLGRYELRKRYSPKFKTHLLVRGVPGRSLILLHPANDAKNELMGCIAPVSLLTSPGKGSGSRKAFDALLSKISEGLKKGPVYLIIKSNDDEIN